MTSDKPRHEHDPEDSPDFIGPKQPKIPDPTTPPKGDTKHPPQPKPPEPPPEPAEEDNPEVA